MVWLRSVVLRIITFCPVKSQKLAWCECLPVNLRYNNLVCLGSNGRFTCKRQQLTKCRQFFKYTVINDLGESLYAMHNFLYLFKLSNNSEKTLWSCAIKLYFSTKEQWNYVCACSAHAIQMDYECCCC